MAGFTDALERALLDHITSKTAYSPPATWYLGLSSTAPSDDGTSFTEPSGGAYARVAMTSADWAAAIGGAPASASTSAIKEFPTASATWVAGADLVAWGLFTASSGGTPQIIGALTVPKPVLAGDTFSFASGSLVLQLGDPADTY